MNPRIEVQLGPVQETLLIPLYGRAVESVKSRGLIHDLKSVEIVESLRYDFSKWDGISSLVGATIRARAYDEQVKKFLDEHPRGSVIEIGAGLNTRYERLDNGQAHWLEIDLPDSMQLRRRFFQDTTRRTLCAASVLDQDWFEKVRAMPEPYLFVSEAVLIYLDELKAEAAIGNIARAFPGGRLLLDTTSTKMVEGQSTHDAMGKMSKESWFRWKCDEPRSLEALGMKLLASKTVVDVGPEIRRAMPLSFRLMYRFAPWLVHRRASGYRVNLFEFISV